LVTAPEGGDDPILAASFDSGVSGNALRCGRDMLLLFSAWPAH
jgi:hypothetical protein